MYVEFKDINKSYGDFKASKSINFGVEKGKLIGLLGPSGSGKTTILRMIAGLETPDFGEIIIDGQVVNEIPASQRGIGFVFQNYALFRHMTIYENVAFGLRVKKENKKYTKKFDNEKVTKEPVWFNKVNEASEVTEADKEELENLLKEFK